MRYIHLLYVPTMACNMSCDYCYLGDSTKDAFKGIKPLDTLRYAVNKLAECEITPFNISLHGGEVTTLGKDDFRAVVGYIDKYYKDHKEILSKAGFTTGQAHIKTNLLGLDEHIDAIREFGVSVSGSLDLPLSLHEKHRKTKSGDPTLNRILQNVALLQTIPNRKKVSATIFREHYEKTDEIISDIKFLHENTCLDMLDFNFMIGFDFNSRGILHPLTEDEQLDFYHKIRDAFVGTELEAGVKGAWFKEFGPEYCTNCDNCGEKFFLLEKNGDVYSCVRGQGNKDFYYGNIYKDEPETIFDNAKNKIAAAHGSCGFSNECAECGYLYVCKTGCPFVKKVNGSAKSYTCALQRELYNMWSIDKDDSNRETVSGYVAAMHTELKDKYALPRIPMNVPSIQDIIASDPTLKNIFSDDAFILKIDGVEYELKPQILREERTVTAITPESSVTLYIKSGLFEDVCDYPENNAIYIQLLSGDMIVYGDEGRYKQRHIANEMIYKYAVESNMSDKDGYMCCDVSHFFAKYGRYLSKEKENNVFFTTTALRDRHYAKQKNNAFYHIQAMDLPFQNIEFYYLTMEDFKNDADNL